MSTNNNNIHLVVSPPAAEELSDAEPPEITHATMVKSGNVLIVQANGSSSDMESMDMLDLAYAKLRADRPKMGATDVLASKARPHSRH